ncbi:MAG: dihydrofolate reductase [Chitinophagales bacterium]|nr:dihydrofolate reductase [Chitinophagales bacterium]
MIVSSIVAMTQNRVIGKDNEIPWYLPADLAYFKKVTLGHAVIMGRNSFISIGRPLPKRTNIIITRDPFYVTSCCPVAHSIQEALEIAYNQGEEEAFIIGGGQIFSQSVDLWDRLYLTEVHAEIEGDILFPDVDMSQWHLESEVFRPKDEKNIYDCTFKVYERT